MRFVNKVDRGKVFSFSTMSSGHSINGYRQRFIKRRNLNRRGIDEGWFLVTPWKVVG
jgi:hypothetical protein